MSKTTTAIGTTLEHRIGPRGRFELRQASGDIVIRGVEGDTVRIKSLDDKPLSDVFDIEIGDDRVDLRQRGGFDVGMRLFSRGSGADLKIEVPHGAAVSVDTGSADIDASDLSGAKTFRTASGEVNLNRIAGGVDVETVSGEIEIDGAAPLDLAAKSVSGDIRVRVPSIRRLDLGTTSGDIRLDAELTGSGPFAMRSISGDATIVGRTGFRVEAESITGDLLSDQPSKRESLPGRKVLIVGRPGPTLTFRSVSGDLHVVEPRDAAPAVQATVAEETVDDAAQPSNDQNAEPEARAAEDKRLEVLRALERGDITVAEATEQLTQLDEVLR
jgi:Putative adhesin